MYDVAVVWELYLLQICHTLTNDSGVLLDLDLPLTSGATIDDDDLPLPTFSSLSLDPQEQSYYMHFLAEISLSRLIIRIRSFHFTFNPSQFVANFPEESPFKDEQDALLSPDEKATTTTSNYRTRHHHHPQNRPFDAIILEMDRQLEEWRAYLPYSLQWNDGHMREMPNATAHPLTGDPLFVAGGALELPQGQLHNLNVSIAVLKSRYLHAKFMIWTPVFYKAVHFPSRLSFWDFERCGEFLKVGGLRS